MKTYFLPAIKITLLTMVLFGVMYPLFIAGVAKLVAPGNGKGETIERNGETLGFEVIGQSFTEGKYFNSRPSAVNYNAAATGGSNKGPNNPDYLKTVDERITDFLHKNPGIRKEDIPVDLITASGGGLDPHISVQAAAIQIKRIARARRMKEDVIDALVKEYTERPFAGILGPSRINVLKINLALDGVTQP